MKKFEKFLKEINSGDNIQDDAYMLIHEDNEKLQKRRQQLLNYLDKPETQQNKTKRDRYKNELNKIRNQLANRTPSGKLSGGFDDATGEGKVDYPKSKKELIKKRNEYGISWDKKNKTSTITKDGLEKYARTMKRNNLPLTKDELDKAREYAIGGKEIKDARGKVIGKTTGKYGGKIATPAKKTSVKYKKTFGNFAKQAVNIVKKNKKAAAVVGGLALLGVGASKLFGGKKSKSKAVAGTETSSSRLRDLPTATYMDSKTNKPISYTFGAGKYDKDTNPKGNKINSYINSPESKKALAAGLKDKSLYLSKPKKS